MLRVYTRHYPPCSRTDIGYRRCHCPKWINGLLPTGKFVRISANTRSWEGAERKARLMEINADPLHKTSAEDNVRITIEEAVRDFLADEEARQLAKTTTCQSRTLLEQQLLPWAKTQSAVVNLHSIESGFYFLQDLFWRVIAVLRALRDVKPMEGGMRLLLTLDRECDPFQVAPPLV